MNFSNEESKIAKEELSKLLQGLFEDLPEEVVDRLFSDTMASLNEFKKALSTSKKFRRVHDELRRLWKKCSLQSPKKNEVVRLTRTLSKESFDILRKRAECLFPKWTEREFNRKNFDEWLTVASTKELAAVLMSCIAEATHVVPGRSRPNGTQSRPHLEPQIMGYVRRSESKDEIELKKQIPPNQLPSKTINRWRQRGGYEHGEATEQLIRHLAIDFSIAIGDLPFNKPKDERVFLKFLEIVFSWIDKDVPKDRVTRLRQSFRPPNAAKGNKK